MGAIKYIGNVGKSLAYASIDVVKDLNPAITSFVETNKDVGKIAYSSIRDFKATTQKVGKIINENEYTGYVKTTFKSLFHELKTGKWYDKQKLSELDSALAEAYINDDNPFLDDSDEFGDDPFAASDDSQFLAESIDDVGMRSSDAISTAILKSTEVQSGLASSMHEENKVLNATMYTGLRNDLGAANLNLANILEFNTQIMQPHVQNSTQFYETQTNLMAETRDILKEMLETQKAISQSGNARRPFDDTMDITDILDANGMVDISSVGKFLKQSANSLSGGAFDMLGMMKEVGMIDQIAQNPMQFITKALMSGAVSPALKKSFERFNGMLSGVASNAILRLNKWDGDPNFIKNFLGEHFSLNQSVRDRYSLSRYNKDATTWTGKDHKALTEVIPTLLSSINANLGGTDMRFDYESGEFVTRDQIKASREKMFKSAAQRSASDIYYRSLDPQIRKVNWSSKEEENLFREQLNKVIEHNFKNSEVFDPNEHHDASKYGINVGSAEQNEEIMRRIEQMWAKVSKSAQIGYAQELIDAMKSYNRQLSVLEDSGDSAYNILYNNSDKLIADNPISNAVSTVYPTTDKRKLKRQKRKDRKNQNIIESQSKSQTSQSINLDWDQLALDRARQEHPEYFNEDGSLKDDYELKNGVVVKEQSEKRNPLSGGGLSKALDFAESPISDFVDMMSNSIYNVFFPKDKEDSEEQDMTFTQKIAYAMTDFANEKASALHDYFEDYFGTFRDYFKEKLDKFKENEIVSGFRGGIKEGFSNLFEYIKKSFTSVGSYTGVTEKTDNDTSAADELSSLLHNVNTETQSSSTGNADVATESISSNALGGKIITMPYVPKLMSYAAGGVIGEGSIPIESYAPGAKKVSKTGFAVVSKGETIIPGDHNNPKSASNRMNSEIDVLSQIMTGKEAEDTVYNSAWRTIVDEQKDLSKMVQLTKANSHFLKWIQSDKEKMYILDRAIAKTKRDKIVFGKNMFKEAKNGYHAIKDEIKKTKNNNTTQDQEKEINSTVAIVMEEMKKEFPNMVTGGIVGTGVSLLTGMIGGPIIGAAAGAGIGLLSNSKRMQRILFGSEVTEVDEDGKETKKMSGGLLPSTVATLIKKYAPSMANGATVGAITSIMPFVPGGPLAGILVGSAIGFASQNESLRQKIFGLFGKDTTEKDFQHKLQKVLPKMGLGALGGLVVGPFGPATNIILGSALGFATDTAAFKDAFFGTEVVKQGEDGKTYTTREGGIFGKVADALAPLIKENKKWLKEKVKTPIERLISPLQVQIKQVFSSVFGLFGKLTTNIYQLFRDHMAGTKTGKALKTIGKGALGLVKLPIGLGGKLVSATGNKLRRHQLRVGTAYQVKGLETAAQRNEERRNVGKGIHGTADKKYSRLDKALENMDQDEIINLYQAQRAINDVDKFTDEQRINQRNRINTALKKGYMKNVRKKTKVKIRNLAAEGNYEQALKLINGIDIGPEEKDELVQEVIDASYKVSQLDNPDELVSESRKIMKKFLKNSKAKGNFDNKLLEQILKSEVNAIEDERKTEEDEEKEQIPEVIKDNTSTIVGLLTDIKDALTKEKQTVSEKMEASMDSVETKDTDGNILHDQQLEGNKFRYEFVNGKPIRIKLTNGEELVDTTNSETRDTLSELEEDDEEEKEERHSIKDAISGLFNRFKKKDKEDEEGEKTGKTGIFGTLLKFFTGGSKVGTAIKTGAAGLIGIAIADKLELTDKLLDAGSWIINTGLPKFANWMNDIAIPKLIDGFSAFVSLLPSGIEVVLGKILPALIPVLIRSLPDIASAIVDGLAKLPGAIADAWREKHDSNTYYQVQTVAGGQSGIQASVLNNKSSIKKTMNGVTLDYSVGSNWKSANTTVQTQTKTIDGYMGAPTAQTSGSANKAIAKSIKKGVKRDDSLPKAFNSENSNDAVYAKAASQYESIADNIVTVNGAQMTVAELLNSDQVVGTVTNPYGDTISVRGYELLQYPELASEYGIDATLTDEMKDAQRENLGIESSKSMKKRRYAISIAEGILRPKAAGRVSKILGGPGKALTKVGKKIPSKGPLKLVSATSNILGGISNVGSKIFGGVEKVGYKLRGLDVPTSLSETVVDTAGRAVDDIGAGLADPNIIVNNKKVQNTALKKGLDAVDDIADNKKIRTKMVEGIKDFGSAALAKADNLSNGKIMGAMNSVVDAKGKVVSKMDDVVGAVRSKLPSKIDDTIDAGMDVLKKKGSKLAASADGGLLTKWAGKLRAGLTKLMGDSKVLSKFKKIAKETGDKFSEKALNEAVEKLGKKLAEFLIENGMKKLGAAVAKITAAAVTAGIAEIVTAVYGFVCGYRDANTIMGVTEMPSTACRVACGIVQALNESFLLGLVPLDLVFDLVWSLLKAIFPSLANTNLEKARKDAIKELDEYNAEHGTDLTLEEYNKKDRLTYKAWNYVKTAASDAWDKITGKDDEDEADRLTTVVANGAELNKRSSITTTSTPQSKNDDIVTAAQGTKRKMLAGKGSGLTGKGFISQLDPKYASKPFGNDGDTIGEAGCGPASAAMAVNQYNSNNGLGLESAASHALRYKATNDGVTPDYFADEFARDGLSTEYINGSRSDLVKSAISSNNPVVLMGADRTNKSKKNSPFGPNNHYVVASGTSKDGSITYINDPEADHGNIAYPTSKILRSTKLAMAPYSAKGSKLASALRNSVIRFGAARGSYGSDTPQYKVWTRMRGAGYSEYAVAGAMGNIHHESGGFDPAAIEKGNGGGGLGLCQWTDGRRDQLNRFASARNASPIDVNLQIDFLLAELDKSCNDPNVSYQLMDSAAYGFKVDQWINATDLSTSTQAFCRCFERPIKNCGMDERIKWAQTYYQEFTGTPGVVGNSTYASAETLSSGDSPTGGTEVADTTETTSSGNILTKLLSGIDQMASIFGLTDSLNSATTATDPLNSSTDTTGLSTTGNSYDTVFSDADASGIAGNVSSNPAVAEKQKQLVGVMKAMQNKLHYSQKNPRNPEQGQADCSSTVNWAYKKVLGVDIGNTTRDQRTDPDTYTVATDLNDESKLQLGDILLRDGHVEMYYGPGKMIGHGGPNYNDLGPTVKDLGRHPDGKPFNLVKRWVGFQNNSAEVATTGNNTVAATGSGLLRRGGRGSDINPLGAQIESYDNATSSYTNSKSTPAGNTTINVSQDPNNNLFQAVMKVVQNTAYLQQVVTLLTQLITLTGSQQSVKPGMTDDEKQAVLNNAKEIANTKSTLVKLLSDNAKQGNGTDIGSLINSVEGLAVQ